MQADVIACCLL